MQELLCHGRVFPACPPPLPKHSTSHSSSNIIWINIFQQVELGAWWLGRSRFIAESSTDLYTRQALLIDSYVLNFFIHIYCKSVDALVKKKYLKMIVDAEKLFELCFLSMNTKSTALWVWEYFVFHLRGLEITRDLMKDSCHGGPTCPALFHLLSLRGQCWGRRWYHPYLPERHLSEGQPWPPCASSWISWYP